MGEDSQLEVSPETVNDAFTEVRRMAKAGRSWVVPLVTGVVLVAVFCGYYFVYVASRREYLTNRNFRALALLGNQLQAFISIHGSILEYYADLPRNANDKRLPLARFLVKHKEDEKSLNPESRKYEERKDYLNFLAPSLQLLDLNDTAEHGPRLQVERRNGRWEMVLAAVRHPKSDKDTKAKVEIEDLLNPLVDSQPFDDILLVDDQGRIVYQHKKAGPQYITLAELLPAQVGTAGSKRENEASGAAEKKAPVPGAGSGKSGGGSVRTALAEKDSDPAPSHNVARLTDVTLSGTAYKLFVQPLVLDVYTDDPSQFEKSQQWAVCGLRSSSALQWESLSISYDIVIWFTAAFLAICMSGPLLKVLFMNHRERLRLRELGSLGLFLLLLCSVFTLAVLHAIHFGLKDDTEDQLQGLTENLASGIRTELQQMQSQLKAWCGEAAEDLRDAQRKEVIRRGTDKTKDDYPYLSNVFWTDDDGIQVVKWSLSQYMTPLIDISDQPVYKHPRTVYLDGRTEPFYFTSVLPPNKLDYVATFAMATCDCNPDLCRPNETPVTRGSAFLTAKPFSLIDPILPFGFGFALVDDTGLVLFHSDKRRNLRENFEQETDWNRELHAATFGHAAPYSFSLKYLGNDYKARAVPIPGLSQAPWSLIVYRDLTTVRTANLQALSMSSVLLLWFLGGPTLIVAVWSAIRRPRFAPEWLWPHRRRLPAYQSLIYLYGLIIVFFLVSGFAGSGEQNLFACFAMPYAVLVASIWSFRRAGSAAEKPETSNKDRFPALPAVIVGLGALALLVGLLLHRENLRTVLFTLGWSMVAVAPVTVKPGHTLIRRFKQRYEGHVSPRPNADQPEPARLNFQGCYLLSVLLLLLLLGVLLPMALFRTSAMVERRLGIKQAQMHLAAAMTQRRAALQAQCEDEGLRTDVCEKYKNADDMNVKSDQAGHAIWDIPLWHLIVFGGIDSDKDKLCFKPPACPQGQPDTNQSPNADEFYADWFRWIVYRLHHNYNNVAAETLGIIRDRVDAKERDHSPDWSWREDRNQITLTSHGLSPWKLSEEQSTKNNPKEQPKKNNPEEPQDLTITTTLHADAWRNMLTGIGVAAGVMLAIGGLLWALARKVFLFQVSPLKIAGARQVLELLRKGQNVLVLLPPVSAWQLEMPKATLDLKRLAQGTRLSDALEVVDLPSNCLIEIQSFEYGEDDPEIEEQKIELLKKLACKEATQLAVVMTTPASAKDYRRKYEPLHLEVVDLRDEPFHWLKQYEGPARDLIWQECGPMAALWPIGAQLAKDIKDEPAESEDTVATEILERADGYYRLIWNECSEDQKFVLSQLAEDGLLNPTNGAAIRQLMRRGLIVKDPQFRIMNESFRRFLESATAPEIKEKWLRESRRTGWGKLRGAFFIAIALVGIFLLTTQNALWQSSAAYVTTALGALGTLSKLLSPTRSVGTTEKVA